ncbi:hypothetical protein HDV03_004048 [Kappamyces sp. JEL0829]|nr:hypothetical protein HDV03_004048 [Kappamyces sp. JEL0829]
MINLTSAADDLNDEALIRAIRRMNDPEEEPNRQDSCSDDESESDKIVMPQAPVDKDMERMQNDTALRHHLKIGSSFTGPKGVKADYKFHMQQERARTQEKRAKDFEKLSNKALSSGWLQRTLHDEDNREDEFMKSYRQKRIAELTKMAHASRFGSVIELQKESYVRCIDNEAPDTKVLIHLYDLSSQASRLVNDFFTALAPMYPSTKFCRIPALGADPNFDLIGLPAILVYKGGHLEISLIRVIDEIPGWAESNVCTLRDFEEYLLLQDVLEDQAKVASPPSYSDDEDDFSDLDQE